MAVLAHPDPPGTAPTRTLVSLEDAEVRRGCDRAFEELYGRYHRRIAAAGATTGSLVGG